MGSFLGAVLHAAAQLLAGVFSALFVAATVLALTLISVDGALLNADTYKRALAEQGIYERIPALAAEQLAAMETFIADPCSANPLVCRIDGASPELQACLTDALGGEALEDIGSMRREPTEAELQLAQPCLDQFAVSPAPATALAASSEAVQSCVRDAVGEEVFDTLLHDERPPTDDEAQAIAVCSEGETDGPVADEERGAPGGEGMGFLQNLTPEDWATLIGTVVPPAELQVMVEQALDQTFAFLDGDVESAKISMVALRERLSGQAGKEIIEILLAAQPPCTDDQLAQLQADLAAEEGGVELCQPQGENADALVVRMQDRFEALVADMPDEAVLIKPPSASAAAGGGPFPGDRPAADASVDSGDDLSTASANPGGPLGGDPATDPDSRGGPLGQDPLTAIRIIRRWLWLVLAIPAVLLLAVTVFGVRSRKGWLRWWGIPLFLAGLLTAGLGIAAGPALDWAWASYIAENMPPLFSSSLSGLAHELAASVAGALTLRMLFSGGVVLLLGLTAIVASSYVRPGRSAAVFLRQDIAG